MTIEERVYREIAKELDLPVLLVRKICRSQFLLSKKHMSDGTFPRVNLQYLGKFYPLEHRMKKRNKVRKYED